MSSSKMPVGETPSLERSAMSSGQVATVCQAIGTHWADAGHEVLASQFYRLLRHNDFKSVVALLNDVDRRMPTMRAAELLDVIISWARNGASLERLTTEDSFLEAEAAMGRTARVIQGVVAGRSVPELVAAYAKISRRDEGAEAFSSNDDTADVVPTLKIDSVPPSVPTDIEGVPNSNVSSNPLSKVSEAKSVFKPIDAPCSGLPPHLVVGGIIMLQALVIFFCLLR